MKRVRERKYLQEILKIDSNIIDMQADADKWRSIAQSSTAFQSGERVQSSGNKDKMGGAMDICMDIENEIAEMRSRRKQIIDDIRSLPQKECNVLFKKYVLGKDYYEIADAMGKDYSGVTTIHGNGLQMIKKILDERELQVYKVMIDDEVVETITADMKNFRLNRGLF